MDYWITDDTSLTAARRHRIPELATRLRIDPAFADPRWEKRLNRDYFACGCESGSMAVMLALVATIATGFMTGFTGALTWYWIPAWIFAAALAGKVLGLIVAKVDLRVAWHRFEATTR